MAQKSPAAASAGVRATPSADGAPVDTDEPRRTSGMSRRDFMANLGTAYAGTTALGVGSHGGRAVAERPGSFKGPAEAQDPGAGEPPSALELSLRVNGAEHRLQVDPRTTLLDLLRERMGLAGTKKGCDHGQCGACTVLIDGRRINSCLALALSYDGADVTTIEGLARGEALHPMQAAFIRHDGLQCGYCTSGQICSAVGMLQEIEEGAASRVTSDVMRTGAVQLTDDEIRERMSGNICRCGAYPGIVAAVREVSLMPTMRRTRT